MPDDRATATETATGHATATATSPAPGPATVAAKGAWSPVEAGPHHVLGPGAHLPVMTLRESALASNIAVMQAFVDRHGLVFAPHMKTHMAPALAARQIDAGAWGVTVASVQQAMVAAEHGIRHVLVANEVLDPAGLAWLGSRPDGDFLSYVDSVAGVAAASAAATAVAGSVHVLVEIGFSGGRTGVRSADAALDVARAAAAAPGVVLRGVSGYEGGLPTVEAAHAYVAGVLGVARVIRGAGLVRPGEPDNAHEPGESDDAHEPGEPGRMILSMGGSAYFDAVVDALADRPTDLDVVLRSGAYLTHDDGAYEHKTPFHRIPEQGSLRAAIEIWGRVTSVPEPGLALVAVGKRDAPFDEGLPVVRRLLPRGTPSSVPADLPPGALTVTRMDDQHAYLAVSDGTEVVPGDVVVLGVSHPCTAFDKWRSIHLVDDADVVVETIGTWF
ncbi:alanine racemase [Curtobacterium sp. RRHDQ10]|uniref:alanine racemase n=1 Tax=Curtobacterium phyllosphaerae TaxID=3413379 RepID=UPI003BF1D68A